MHHWESDEQRKAAMAKCCQSGRVTLKKFKRSLELPEPVMEEPNQSKQNSSNRKGWFEDKKPTLTKKGIKDVAPMHHKVTIKKEAESALNKRMVRSTQSEYLYPRSIIKPTSIVSQKSAQERDSIDKISKVTEKLTPIKTALQLAFPQAVLPIEVGYQVLTNLDTIRDVYNYSGNSNDEIKKALNETLENAAKHVINSVVQPIKENMVSDIVDNSSKYLEDKQIFKDITEKLSLGDSYSDDFRDFYKTSLRNCLNQIYENVNPFR